MWLHPCNMLHQRTCGGQLIRFTLHSHPLAFRRMPPAVVSTTCMLPRYRPISRCVTRASRNGTGKSEDDPSSSNDLFDTLYAQQGQRGKRASPPPPAAAVDDDEELWQRLYTDPFVAPDLQHFSHSKGSLGQEASSLWGKLLYTYYNWRRDTWSDLQLFTAVNFAFVMLCVAAKSSIVSAINSSLPVQLLEDQQQGLPPPETSPGVLGDLYRIAAVILGQNFPEDPGSVGVQVFYLTVGLLGVASFALVLALIEQVVLEGFEANVSKGSAVYEVNHYVLLTWGAHNADTEVTAKIMRQLCYAHRADGGCTVVVLSCNSKLDMESRFARIIPERERLGTRFVFRQGSPLLPTDLRFVSVNTAAAVIIINDRSRSAKDADAQSVRAAVLVDELDFPGFAVPDTRRAHIVVECMTQGSQDLLLYACSQRVVPCPTAKQDARRLVRMLRFPIISIISVVSLNWRSASKIYAEPLTGLEGMAFRDLLGYFPDGCLMGILHPARNTAEVCPPGDALVEPGDYVMLQRPTTIPRMSYQRQTTPVPLPIDLAGLPPAPTASSTPAPQQQGGGWTRADDIDNAQGVYCAADEFMSSDGSLDHDYVCSLTGKALTWAPEEERGDAATLPMTPSGVFVQFTDHGASQPQRVLIIGLADASFMDHLLNTMGRGRLALPTGSHITLFNAHPLSSQPLGGFACVKDLLPVDVAGLERSTSLPKQPSPQAVQLSRDGGDIAEEEQPFEVSIEHVLGDPLNPQELKRRLEIETYDAAIVLCDRSWIDNDEDRNGIGGGLESDALRQDSCIMTVQLHLRRMLEAKQAYGCHIVCQTMSSDVVTRFEDINRLPAGITLNRQNHAAEMLVQASMTPMAVRLFDYIGDAFETRGIHPRLLTREGESICFWTLQQRGIEAGMCVLGWLELPDSPESAVRLVFNPEGEHVRSLPRVWWREAGPQRLWLVVVSRLQVNLALDASRDSGDSEVEDGMVLSDNPQYRSALFGVLSSANTRWAAAGRRVAKSAAQQ